MKMERQPNANGIREQSCVNSGVMRQENHGPVA